MAPEAQKIKEWVNLSLDCDIHLVPRVCELLETLGAQAVTIEHHEILEQQEFDATVIGLFEAESFTQAVPGESLKMLLPEASLATLSEQRFADRDWVRNAEQQHEPVQVLDRLLIAAPWHSVDSTDKNVLVINPGMAFGTGHHPTTRLCLEQLARINVVDKTVIDFGCGSGVLACASLLLGAKRAWGIDTDPDCLIESTRNARINEFDSCYTALNADDEAVDSLRADVVAANIYADALIRLAPRISCMVNAEGWLILSGMLVSQVQAVLRVYATAFDLNSYADDRWSMLAGRSKAPL